MNKTGKTVEDGGIVYEFSSEEDAIGFVNCCNGTDGRPRSCAVEWRCIDKKRKVNEKDTGPER